MAKRPDNDCLGGGDRFDGWQSRPVDCARGAIAADGLTNDEGGLFETWPRLPQDATVRQQREFAA